MRVDKIGQAVCFNKLVFQRSLKTGAKSYDKHAFFSESEV